MPAAALQGWLWAPPWHLHRPHPKESLIPSQALRHSPPSPSHIEDRIFWLERVCVCVGTWCGREGRLILSFSLSYIFIKLQAQEPVCVRTEQRPEARQAGSKAAMGFMNDQSQRRAHARCVGGAWGGGASEALESVTSGDRPCDV